MSRGLGQTQMGVIDWLWRSRTAYPDGLTVGLLAELAYNAPPGMFVADWDEKERAREEAVRRALRGLRRLGVVEVRPARTTPVSIEGRVVGEAPARSWTYRLTDRYCARVAG